MTDNNSIDNKSVNNHDAKTLNSKSLDESGGDNTSNTNTADTSTTNEGNTEGDDKNGRANIDSNKKSVNKGVNDAKSNADVKNNGTHEGDEKKSENSTEKSSDKPAEKPVEKRSEESSAKNHSPSGEKKILSLKIDSKGIGQTNDIASGLNSNFNSNFGGGISSSLNKSVSRDVSGVVRQSFAHGKSRQVQIEVKGKKKFGLKANDNLESDSSKNELKSFNAFNGDINELKKIFPNLTKSEIELRMKLVKRMGDSDSEKDKQSAENMKGSMPNNTPNGHDGENGYNRHSGDNVNSHENGLTGAVLNIDSTIDNEAATGTSTNADSKFKLNSDSNSNSTSPSKSFKSHKVDKKSKSQLSDEEKLPAKKKGKVSAGFKTDKIKEYNIYDDDLDDLDSLVDVIDDIADISENDDLVGDENESNASSSGNLNKSVNKNTLHKSGAVNKSKLNSILATKFDSDKKKLSENSSKDGFGAFAKSETNAGKKDAVKKEKRKVQSKSIMIPSAGLILSDLAHRLSVNIEEIEKIAEDLGVELSDRKLSDKISIDKNSSNKMNNKMSNKMHDKTINKMSNKAINKKLSKEAVELIAQHFDYEVIMDTIDGILHDSKPRDYTRPPVVVVMGHVDHGKTSLLDAMRKSNVVSGEKGGITQHIGAYSIVTQSQEQITFIDTPGHALFKDMRARGVNFTDIAILVVAADDGVKEQTVEAITHAQSVNMPIVVAINKMDREGADVERVRRELANYNVIVESYGGDVMEVQVSAKNGSGIVELQNAILLQSQMMDLKTYVNGRAQGFVIESRVDKGKGPVATILIRDGTLNSKDIFVCGDAFGKVRLMTNDMAKNVKVAGPSSVVVVSGFDELPVAGEKFSVVRDEKDAKTVIESRVAKNIDEVTEEIDPFAALKNQNKKELFFVIKADVAGSIDAIKFGLESLSSEEVKITVIKAEVGDISESDLSIAHLSNATVIGFNVKSNLTKLNREYEKVPVRYYNIIYKLIDDVVERISENKEQKFNHIFIGLAEVVKVFDMKDDTGKFRVAGCIVRKGEMRKSSKVKVLRNEEVIFDMGDMRSLQIRRIDSDIVPEKEECGIVIKKFMSTEVGYFIECFDMEKIID